jgi:hypothetical protein
LNQFNRFKIIDNKDFTATVTGDDIYLRGFTRGTITIKTGTETGTVTLDAKLQVKDINGNYIDHTSATQVTTASTSLKNITDINAYMGRVVVTFTGGENEKYAATTVELTLQ